MIAILRTHADEPVVMYGQRHETRLQFMARVFDALGNDEDKLNRLVAITVEFIWE